MVQDDFLWSRCYRGRVRTVGSIGDGSGQIGGFGAYMGTFLAAFGRLIFEDRGEGRAWCLDLFVRRFVHWTMRYQISLK